MHTTDSNLICPCRYSAERVANLNARVAASRSSRTDISPVAAVAGVKNVQVYFHVIAKDTTVAGGYVTDQHVANQIAALNRDLAYAGFSFTLAAIDRTVNADWFNYAGPDTSYQTAMKRALRRGTAASLNFYSVGYTSISVQGLLGYATFPSSYRSNPLDDGVSFLFRTMPGLPTGVTIGSNYNQGKTGSHEVGHWIGLYHTFQGGCSATAGDYVSDTPAVAQPNSGCPAQGSVDSCSGGGPDSVSDTLLQSQEKR